MELTEQESWLLGFDLGYRACVIDDAVISDEDFIEKMSRGDLDDLLLMMNVGRDQENGIWTMAGIRMAIYMLLLADWDSALYKDESVMTEVWESIKDNSPEVVAATVAEPLMEFLSIPIVMIDESASAFIRPYLAQ